jgi:hypothetical protein
MHSLYICACYGVVAKILIVLLDSDFELTDMYLCKSTGR